MLNTLVHNTPHYATADFSGREHRNELNLQVHRGLVATSSEHDVHTICRGLNAFKALKGDAILCY